MPFCNSENGDYKHLLVEGGIMEQPYISCKILDLIRLNYKKFIADSQEKRLAEMRTKSKRGRR